MKKLLFLSFFALAGAIVARADSKSARTSLVERVETCEAILQEFQNRPETAIPAAVWQKARGVMIVNQFKAGFVLGVKGGYGVIMVKKADGRWSLPVLVNAGEASLGFQVGANATETIYILTNDTTPRLLFNQRVNIGVDAKAVAGPKAAEAETNNREILATPVLVYSKARGLYAGATVKAGYVSRNDDANFTLYHTKYSLPELLYSDWVDPVPEVKPLMDLVKKFAP
ncbi:MAG TPA: lipid-binding SYLF domain-containing protein [Opitutaceae bacterium]|nr:lipid-binding SYLF domain-containing protein [Opitutaceae bacterium]